MTAKMFPSWTIYERPTDFPEGYIARRFDIRAGQAEPTDVTITGNDLDDVRERLLDNWPHLVKLDRSPDDDPTVVETWL